MNSVLGHGVYSIAEAARYTGASARSLSYWFRHSENSLLCSDYADTTLSRGISFYDLIDSLVVANMRRRNVSMKHIRQVHEYFSTKWSNPHPFCTERFFVDVSKKRIVEDIKEDDGQRLLVDALLRQGEIEEAIMPYLERVMYSEVTRMAVMWNIHDGIVIDPLVRFGKPVIQGTRLTTQVIASQYKAYDGDALRVARIYRITERGVRDAVDFEASKGTVKIAA